MRTLAEQASPSARPRVSGDLGAVFFRNGVRSLNHVERGQRRPAPDRCADRFSKTSATAPAPPETDAGTAQWWPVAPSPQRQDSAWTSRERWRPPRGLRSRASPTWRPLYSMSALASCRAAPRSVRRRHRVPCAETSCLRRRQIAPARGLPAECPCRARVGMGRRLGGRGSAERACQATPSAPQARNLLMGGIRSYSKIAAFWMPVNPPAQLVRRDSVDD